MGYGKGCSKIHVHLIPSATRMRIAERLTMWFADATTSEDVRPSGSGRLHLVEALLTHTHVEQTVAKWINPRRGITFMSRISA